MIYEYETDYTDYLNLQKQEFVSEISAKVADTTDKVIMSALCEYADEYAKAKGERYRLLIIDEKKAQELIELGMRAYEEGKRI